MFTVYLFKFSKRENSTKVPATSAGTSFSCILKDDSNIITPVIQLDIGNNDFPDYNYAYIPSFGRYYYISDWTNSNTLWMASLQVDVLATYKSQIGSTSLYILRASAEKDGNIIDTLYPASTNSTNTPSYFNLPYASNGVVVLGVVNTICNFGSLTYYVMNPSAFSTTVQYLLDDSFMQSVGFKLDDCSITLQKSLSDPLQYVKSCIYLPYTYGTLSNNMENREVWLFDFKIMGGVVYDPDAGQTTNPGTALTAGAIKNSSPTYTYETTVTIPKHPQTTGRGNFVNVDPYTNLTLFCPPFGAIALDTTKFANSDTMHLVIKTDLLTGLGLLTVMDEDYVEINRIEAQIGVELNLSQVTRDFIGATQNLANGMMSATISMAMSNPAGAVMSATSGIMSMINSLKPQCQSVGSGGSMVQLEGGRGALVGTFLPIVDDDNAHNGRPLCKMRTPASLGGYMLVQDGDISAPATQTELTSIKTYLEGGFYYE